MPTFFERERESKRGRGEEGDIAHSKATRNTRNLGVKTYFILDAVP